MNKNIFKQTVKNNISYRHSGLDPESSVFFKKLLDSCLRRNDKIRNLYILYTRLIILLASILLHTVTSNASEISLQKPEKDLQTITIIRKSNTKNGTFTKKISSFIVEVASDVKSRNNGLSGRSELPAGHGMLFMLDNSKENYFWMKDMKFSIDILLFDSRKRVTEIYANLPLCSNCPFIRPKQPVSFALEINSGEADKYGLKVGDLFEFTED